MFNNNVEENETDQLNMTTDTRNHNVQQDVAAHRQSNDVHLSVCEHVTNSSKNNNCTKYETEAQKYRKIWEMCGIMTAKKCIATM